MKAYLILLILLGLSSCGHIYVSDTQLRYQNTQHLKSAQLYFKLENELHVNEVLKIVWPYTLNTYGTVTMAIYTTSSTTPQTTGAASVDSSNSAYLIRMTTKLNAQQWYILNISTANVQTPTVQYYTAPIKMSTHSGMSASYDVAEYLMYDYNNACGFIAIAPAPGALSSVTVSGTETGTSAPSNIATNKYYDASYPVYLTFLTTGDYEYGGTFLFTIDSNFKWTGSCEVLSKTCGDDSACLTVNSLSGASDYTCTVTESIVTFKRYQNSTKLSINHQDYMRIKVSVRNPSFATGGGVSVSLVSNYANYIYEILAKTSQFQTTTIRLLSGAAKYFWNIGRKSGENTGCPVRIFVSDAVAVWNKISFPYYPELTLPDSKQGFYLKTEIKAVSVINELSIYTDASAFGSAAITCVTDIPASGTDKFILCKNIGKMTGGQIKYLKFSFVAEKDATYSSTRFDSFGTMLINRMEDDLTITTSASPTDVSVSSVYDAKYVATGNRVVNMAVTVASGYITAQQFIDVLTTTTENARSSIQYTDQETNLFFPITTTFKQQCCNAHATTDHYDCSNSPVSNLECLAIAASTGLFADNLILKILANGNALTLSSSDKDSTVSTEDNVYKGVDLYTPTAAAKGMFGMAVLPASAPTQDDLCLAVSHSGNRICSTYSSPVTYTEAKTATANKQYLYNLWFSYSDYLELHAVCYSKYVAAELLICGAAENSAMGVLMRNVKLTVVANNLYPQQTDLDFIMCFRYADATSTSLGVNDTTSLASSSLINAQVINFKSSATAGISSTSTMFRVGVLNYFVEDLSTDHVATYVPTLLRVGGFMQTSDITTNNGIAFFFEGVKMVIAESSLSATMPLLPTECGSSTSTGMTCKYYKSKTIQTASTDMHLDYYPGLNAIIIGGVTVTTGEFNYYIPVQIKAIPFTFAFLGLINNYATFPTITSAYKLFGTIEGTSTDLWKNLAVAGTATFTAASLWTVQATTGVLTTTLNSVADWEVSTATIGVLNAPDSTTIVKASNQGNSKSGTIYPGDTQTDVTIDPTIDSGSTYDVTFNDDTHGTTGMKAAGLQYAASAHFMVTSQIKYWSGDITWSLYNATGPFQAKCANMAITTYITTTNKPTTYLIVCPYDGKFVDSTVIKSTTATLTLASWLWPDYYGQDAVIGAHIRYLWTDKKGNLQAYLSEAKKATKRTGCTLGTGSTIYGENTYQKKATLSITPLNTIVLLKSTATVSPKEYITINAIVNASTYATTTTSKCSSGLASIKCSVTKSGSTFSFLLTNVDTKNIQTIPSSQISLTFWLTSTSTSTDTLVYTAQILASFYEKYATQETANAALVINHCADNQPWTSGSVEDRSISVTDPNRDVMVIGARTQFSFSFTSSYTVLDLSKFNIDLAFLATANSNLVSNLRCAVYSSNKISHLFDRFTYSSLTAIEFEYKQQDTTLDKPTEIGTVSYKFQCDGGEVMETAPSSSSKIIIKNILSTTIGQGTSVDQSANYGSLRSVSSSSIANVSLVKTFAYAGQDSTYTFNVKVAAKTEISATNVTTTTIRFKAGSYLYVEFARDISPRFNKLGIIRCYHEAYPTYCKYESERRIAFIARTDLSHNLTYGHNFSIVGIQRPAEFPNYKKMYFALVPYLATFNALEFQDSSTIEDAVTTDQAATILPVVYYSQDSSTAIRSTFTMTMHIKFPTGTVSENIPIWVDFPADFDEAMFLGWSPSCQFKNVKIRDNDTISNFANSCALNSNRRVKLNMTTNSNQTNETLYALTISGIPTYNYEQYHTNAPIVWFGNATSTAVPIYKTNLGNFNGTYNLKTFTFSDVGKQLLTWDSNIPECYIGVYRCTASLKVINSENFFYDIGAFTSSGVYADLFSFNPAKLAVETGKAYKKFEIAPKAATAPGLYQLKWNHEITSYYSLIPPLFIIALNSQTEIAAESATYEVPNGGKSLPIIFDFAGKMPENDVSITGAAKSLEINGTTYITSKYVSFKESQKTLTYSEQYTSSQIQFIVTGQTVTGTNEPEIPSATLSWTLAGTNSKAYKTPSDVTVTVVKAQVGTPELTLATPETTNCVGYQTITAKCSHAGTLYYVVSQDQTATQIEFSTIKTASEDANIQETEIGTVYTNPKRTFYGYYLATNALTDYTITLTGKLQSEATHYLRMFCVNQMETSSAASDTTWKQSSNNGKPLISAMKFQSTNNTNGTQYVTLTAPQKKEVACIICKEAKVEKDRVFGTDGVACAELGTVSTANTTANTTKRLLQTTANATEYYVVMPNLFIADGSLDTVKTTLESSAFSTALTSSTTLTGIALNSITCSINSGYPSTPLINSPSVSPAENSITFTWTGANNTDGFVFVGVVQYTNATVEPTALQLKKNSGYTFDAFNKAFYYKDTSISVTASPATKCLDYKYYWVATNEDPDTYQYTTGIKSGTTKTIGCPTFASMLSQSVLFIALIFLMILA